MLTQQFCLLAPINMMYASSSNKWVLWPTDLIQRSNGDTKQLWPTYYYLNGFHDTYCKYCRNKLASLNKVKNVPKGLWQNRNNGQLYRNQESLPSKKASWYTSLTMPINAKLIPKLSPQVGLMKCATELATIVSTVRYVRFVKRSKSTLHSPVIY